LQARAVRKGPREFVQLGDTLNLMTESLLESNRSLEQKVGERTEELRRSEEHFRALIENSLDIIMGIGPDGALRYVSPSVQRTLGYKPEEMVGKNPSDLVHPDDLPAVTAAVAETLRSLEPGPLLEIRLRHRDGSWRAVEAIGRSFLDESGALGTVLNARDITERKQAEEALRETEAKYHTLVEQIPAVTYIDVVDEASPTGYTPIYFSPQIEATLGYSPEEFIASPELWTEIVHPDDRERALAADALHYATGEPSSHEYRLIARDGHVVWVHEQAVIVEDVSGNATYSQGVLLDITERKQAEKQLRESEARYRELVQQTPAGIFISPLDDADRAVYVSPRMENMFGVTSADWTSDPQWWVKLLHPDDRERVLAEFARAIAGDEHFVSELRMFTRDGRLLGVHAEASVVRDDAGQPYGVQGIVLDISERKRAEEELHKLNRQLEAERQRIQELNRSLEEKVRRRTKDLRLTNGELRERNRQLLSARAQAATDGLTGLPNHRAFHETLRQEVARARLEGRQVGLIMLDIDTFKGINDSEGHQAGDDILRRLAATISETVAPHKAYRYGGDEFAVLMLQSGCGAAAVMAERVRHALENLRPDGKPPVTISLGVSCLGSAASSADELVYGADAAMYWAKAAGRNRVGEWHLLIEQSADGRVPWYLTDRVVRAPDAVTALVAALAAKDPDTSAHTERCSWYTAELSAELGLDQEQASIVRLGSLLHDIGKIAVPDEVLFKPGPLNDNEWVQMKRHPVTGLHILSRIPSIAAATPAVLHHHEHFDGSGYPDGLAGDAIPVASRILLVTDAFDAMTTDRPYRKAMPVEVAIEELTRHRGGQFDPEVVDAFLRILERHGNGIPAEVAALCPPASGDGERASAGVRRQVDPRREVVWAPAVRNK